MDKVQETTLSNGWRVRCRPVPSIAFRGAMRKASYRYPPPPIVEVTTLKGRSKEKVPAPVGSPEWDEYERQRAKVNADREAYRERFTYNYGVLEWSPDGENWIKEPGDEWEADSFLIEEFEIDLLDAHERRAAYIMYDLLCLPQDEERVINIIFAGSLEPVTAAEVGAAEDSF